MSTVIVRGRVAREPKILDKVAIVPVFEARKHKDKDEWYYSDYDLLIFPKNKTAHGIAKKCKKGDAIMAQCDYTNERIKIETEGGNRYYYKNTFMVNNMVSSPKDNTAPADTNDTPTTDDVPF